MRGKDLVEEWFEFWDELESRLSELPQFEDEDKRYLIFTHHCPVSGSHTLYTGRGGRYIDRSIAYVFLEISVHEILHDLLNEDVDIDQQEEGIRRLGY